MARNRKNQPAAIRFGPALKALLLCLAIGGFGIGYVWQQTQIDQLGRQITRRELTLRDLQEKNRKMAGLLHTLASPGWLDQRVRELNLSLGPTQPGQVWRLTEPALSSPPVEASASGSEEKLASTRPPARAGW